MNLLDLIRKESAVSLGKLLFVAAVSAIANAALLVIVNFGLEATIKDEPTFRLLFMFVVLLAIFAITRKHLMVSVSREFEQILHKVRTRVADKVRHADLLNLEGLERAGIYASVQRDTLQISSIGKPLVSVSQAILLLILTLFYMLWLSPWAFLFSSIVILGSSFFYLVRRKELSGALHRVLDRENKVYETLSHVLDGIKETQLHAGRSEELMSYAESRSEAARDQRITVDSKFIGLSVFSQIALYVGLGILVFVLPEQQFEGYSDVSTKVTIAFIFLIGPVFNTVGMIPDIYQAEVAISSISDIESKLDEALRNVRRDLPEHTEFKEIVFEDIDFRFDDPRSMHPFGLGPVNLTITQGDVIFLSGGNGSGKSTLLKLMTALYHPQTGALYLDGTRVEESWTPAYQSLFSTVFSDFHLFDRLYGLGEIDPDRLEVLFRKMEISGKTQIIDGEFATLDLSAGQRKRLALLVAILEDRPILVLDEWAAEQDPEFRKKFYLEIIPWLRDEEGKTIIAVTHDDRYFSAATSVYRMEEGKLSQRTEYGTTAGTDSE